MKEKKEYWQSIRGICILAVILIHSLGGFNYSTGYGTEFVVLRQIINFAVATFVFMAGYFVNVDALSDKEFSYKHWIIYRGGRLCIPFMIWSLLYSGLELLKIVHSGNEIHWFGFVYRFIVGKSATPFYYIVVLVQLTVITPWLVKTVKQNGVISRILNRSPSSRQLKKYKFFLPVEIYLLAVFMQLASKFHVFPLALKFQDSFASVYCCSNLYNLRSFLREYLYQ